MDAAGRNGARNFFANDTGQIEADEHIECLASLLARNHIHVDRARVLNGVFERGLGNLVKSDTCGIFWELQDLAKVPRNCFSFAVFIRCEPDFISVFGSFFKIGNNTFVPRVNFISDVKSVLVDLSIFANVSDGSQNCKIFTEVFLDSVGLGWRLDDN